MGFNFLIFSFIVIHSIYDSVNKSCPIYLFLNLIKFRTIIAIKTLSKKSLKTNVNNKKYNAYSYL